MNSETKKTVEAWLNSDKIDNKTKDELKSYNDEQLTIAMNGYMKFGTAGLRSKMGAGTALMNEYTIAHATAALSKLIISHGKEAMERGVAIAYDSRNNSELFAKRSAEVLSAYGIKAYLYSELRPTPCLSFAVRELNCIAGINVTASHNPKEYNGYKVYWEDGAQISPEQAKVIDSEFANIDIINDVPESGEANPDLILEMSASVDRSYKNKVLEQMVNPDAINAVKNDFKVVYTPLHGAGITMVPDVLKEAGLEHIFIVEEQAKPDGEFPTLKFPNPEFYEAFVLGTALADKVDSQLIIATDPDADRVGVAVKDTDGTYKCITGNQMGALLLDYIITAYNETNTMPVEPYAVKSIVSTALAEKICVENKVKMYDVLTGFKFIGEVIKNHEAEGHGSYIFGFEESYGYLKGTYARDKDAVVTSLLICEMAAYYYAKGMTLLDALYKRIFTRYGFYSEKTESFYFDSLDGTEKMNGICEELRKTPPTTIADNDVLTIRDYKTGVITDTVINIETPTGLPSSNVLYYIMNDCIVVIRPSGTEPKLKAYYMAHGQSKEEADSIIDKYSNAIKILLKL